MPATPWQLYNAAKLHLGTGLIQLNIDTFKLKLCTSGSNASTFTLSTFASVTGEIVAAGGYVAGGKALTGVTWGEGQSAKQLKFDANDLVFTAAGANLENIKYAVIGLSGSKVLCWSRLSASQFTVTDGNTLQIIMNAAGIFTMV